MARYDESDQTPLHRLARVEVFKFPRTVRTDHVAQMDSTWTSPSRTIGSIIALDAQFVCMRGDEVAVMVAAILRDKLSDHSYGCSVDILVVADLVE